jgi:FkbM family methyltransferase
VAIWVRPAFRRILRRDSGAKGAYVNSQFFRNIRYLRVNSAFARKMLRLYYCPGKAYRICFGPLRGLKLQYDHHINFHSVLGLWDTEALGLLYRIFVKSGLVPKDSIIADIGANIGYYTLWFSKIAASKGKVFAFEPNADVLPILRTNLNLNHVYNAEVVEAACADRNGAADFYIASHHHSSSLYSDWAKSDGPARKTTVAVTTLDTFFNQETGRLPPAFIKIDIEGGGTQALPGARRLFAENRPFCLIESHTPEEDSAISNLLQNSDYRAYRLNDRRWVLNPENTHPHPQGVWGTLVLTPAEHYAVVSELLRAED